MLLRRITEHVKDQNWFAVLIDFAIVVFGVFIGIQVANWNDAQEDRRDYELALDRYRMEIETNLEILDKADVEVADVLSEVGAAFDALMTCEDTPENRTLVYLGLNRITGTFGLSLRESALRELTETQSLLAQQSPAERQAFADTRYRMSVFLREARFVETIPLDERAQNNPIIEIGPLEKRNVNYTGVDFSRPVRKLQLKVPLDVACKDDRLVKSFYTWERWQGAMPAVSRILRAEFEDAKERLN